MKSVLTSSVTDTLFGAFEPTLAAYIEAALGFAAEDYDLVGLEGDLRAAIDEVLPAGVTLEGEALMVDETVTTATTVAANLTVEDVRDAVGWIDVHTVAVGHDMAGPGA